MPESIADEEFWSFLLLRMRIAIILLADVENMMLARQHLLPTQHNSTSFSMGNPRACHPSHCMELHVLVIFARAGMDIGAWIC